MKLAPLAAIALLLTLAASSVIAVVSNHPAKDKYLCSCPVKGEENPSKQISHRKLHGGRLHRRTTSSRPQSTALAAAGSANNNVGGDSGGGSLPPEEQLDCCSRNFPHFNPANSNGYDCIAQCTCPRYCQDPSDGGGACCMAYECACCFACRVYANACSGVCLPCNEGLRQCRKYVEPDAVAEEDRAELEKQRIFKENVRNSAIVKRLKGEQMERN